MMCTTYVFYKKPRDYPDKFVVRKFLISLERGVEQAEIVGLFDNQEAARKYMDGMAFIMRSPEDDPTILGVWI